MEYEPDMTNLLLQLKINNIIRSSNSSEEVIQRPKAIKTEVTQKMINEYKELQKTPINIEGREYAYNPAVAVVELEQPNLIPVPFKFEDLLDAEKRAKEDLDDVEVYMEQLKEDMKNRQEEFNIDLDLKDKEIDDLNEKKIEKGTKKQIQIANTKRINRLNVLNDQKNKMINLFNKNIVDPYKFRLKTALEEKQRIIDFINKADHDKAEYKNLENENIKRRNIAEDINKKKIDEYIENIKLLNNKPLQLERLVGESQEDYLNRLQQEVEGVLDDEVDVSFQAEVLNRKKLLDNLGQIIKDSNKKDDIIKLFYVKDDDKKSDIIANQEAYDKIFVVNKFWTPILKKIKQTFGADSTFIKPVDYYDIMKTFFNKTVEQIVSQEREQKATTRAPRAPIAPRAPGALGAPGAPEAQGGVDVKQELEPEPEPEPEPQPEEKKGIYAGEVRIAYTSGDYSVRLIDEDTKQTIIYLKALHAMNNPGYAKQQRLLYLMGSKSGDVGSFKIINNEANFAKLISKKRLLQLKSVINENDVKEGLMELAKEEGYKTFSKLSTITKLALFISSAFREQDPGRIGEYELNEYDKSKDIIYEKNTEGRPGKVIGAGFRGGSIMDKKELEYKKFGDVFINIKKLNKNILVIKDKNKASIKAFVNTRISDYLHDIIMDLLNNVPIKEKDIKTLDEQEQHIYNNLVHIAGKNRDTFNTIKNTISYYKNRFNVLSGEIEAGNDNPKLLNEVYVILNQLYRMGEIKQKQVKLIYEDLKQTQQNI